jgi:glycosyltransferase involved in cell wall biosynthesis
MIGNNKDIAVTKPTILMSFPFVEDGGWFNPVGVACLEALEALGFQVEMFNPVVAEKSNPGWKALERAAVIAGRLIGQSKTQTKDRLPWLGEAIRGAGLVNAARRTQPDYLFVVSTFTYPKGILELLREECGIRKTIGWCVEGPTWIADPNQQANLYDYYFCIHRSGITHPGIHYLPLVGFDAAAYSPLVGERKTRQLVFVGRKKERRVEWLASLKDLGLELYGPEWENSELASNLTAPSISGKDLNLLYNHSKIVLNVSSWSNQYRSCLNLRILDVPATGSMLLTDYAPDIEEYLQPDREVVIAHSPEEMRDKARYYLAHDTQREKIAHAGWERVQQMETYLQKMQRMLMSCGISLPGDS